MSINPGLRNGIVAAALVFGSWVNAASTVCPANINAKLCEQLQTMSDTDWAICRIQLHESMSWIPAGCGRGDTACMNKPPDTSWVQPWRDSILAETRPLFESYDLRWPDDPHTRAPVPTWNGRRDTISYEFHQISNSYSVYATKHSILSIVGEPYISDAENWVPTDILNLVSKPKSPVSAPSRGPFFNLNGQQIETEKAPGLILRRIPIRQ